MPLRGVQRQVAFQEPSPSGVSQAMENFWILIVEGLKGVPSSLRNLEQGTVKVLPACDYGW